MEDSDKTTEQLIEELGMLRRQVAFLEATGLKLRQRVEKWRGLLAALPDAIMAIDREGVVQLVNREVAGLSIGQILGTSVYEHLPVEHHDMVRDSLQRVFKSGEPSTYEVESRGGDGSSRWHCLQVSALTSGDEVMGATLIQRDITKHVLAEEDSWAKYDQSFYPVVENRGTATRVSALPRAVAGREQAHQQQLRTAEALRESEEKFRAISASAFDAVIMVDGDGCVAYWNHAAERMFGYSGDEIIGESFRDTCIPERFRDRFEDELGAYSEVGPARRCGKVSELTGRRRHGAEFPMEIAVSPFSIRGQHWASAVVRDITERKQAEETIAEERAQLMSIFDSIDEMIYIADMDTYEILYANAAVEKLYGKSVVGGNCYRELHGRNTPCEFCTNYIIRNTRGVPYRWENYNPTIKKRFRNTDKLIRWPDGRVVRFQLAIDITEEKKLMQQLTQSMKMESIGRLAGGVAHDFNNLLTGINGYAELIISYLPPDSPLLPDLREIQAAGERAAELTSQLLSFSRKQVMVPKVIRPNQILERSKKMLSRIIGEDVELHFVPGMRLWRIKADPAQLDQILVNLAVNARDAMPEGGELTIATKNATLNEQFCATHIDAKPGEYVVLLVADTGHGMDEETMARIFEPFFSTKSKDRGTGLGLSTVFGIVKQNDGFITVSSEQGRGTVFRVYFPRAKAKGDAITDGGIAALPMGRETILLVEDEDTVRDLAKKILERQGYQVLEAEDGANAFRRSRTHQGNIDLLLTDVIMPNINGRQLYEGLLESRQSLKALYMSGHPQDIIVHHGVLAEGINYLQKPFTIESLARKVRKVLDG